MFLITRVCFAGTIFGVGQVRLQDGHFFWGGHVWLHEEQFREGQVRFCLGQVLTGHVTFLTVQFYLGQLQLQVEFVGGQVLLLQF